MPNPTDPTPHDLPPLPPPPPADSDDVPLALTDLDDAAADLPAAEPVADAVAFDLPDLPDLPDGERTMGVELVDLPGLTTLGTGLGLPPIPPVAPGESWTTDADAAAAVRFDPPAVAAGASSSALFDDPPPAHVGEAAAGVSASSLFGDTVPVAAAADSGVDVETAPAVDPVAPASGWFSAADDPLPAEIVPDAIEAELGHPLPATGHGDGSDIFAAAPPAAAADESDVLGLTAGGDAGPPTPPRPRDGGRPSDIAIGFDPLPGGSTMQEAADDLPVADEVFDAEPLFADSATLAHAPPLPGGDAPDFGAAPAPAGADASNILAGLDEPAYRPADDSGVRLDAPGIDPTLSDEHSAPAEFRAALADDDGDVDFGGVESGSDLIAGARPAGPGFELTPDLPGTVDPFAGVGEGEEPSLSSAPSSIFTTPVAPLSGGSVPPPAEGDAVEFSDHPDPAGAVEFDLADAATYPERTIRAPIPEDDDGELDLTDPDGPRLPHPSTGDVLAAAARDDSREWPAPASGPPSGMLARRPRGGPVNLDDPTDPGTAGGYDADPAAPPRPARQPSTGSVELDWVSASSTNEVVLAEPSRGGRPGRRTPAAADDDDSAERPRARAAGKGRGVGGGLGLLAGLVLGGGVASGVYFSGLVDRPAGPAAAVPPPGFSKPPDGAVVPPPLTVADARAALDAGDPARALKALEAIPADTPAAKAARGQARLLARLQAAGTPAADDAALAAARADLEAVVSDADAAKTADGEKAAVRAAVHLGLTHELAGDRTKAREVYAAGAAKFPKAADVFQAALDRLDATAPPAATSFRLAPADAARLLAAAAVLFVQDDAAPAAEPAEAGGLFWRAANLAAAGRYADAAAALDRAKAAHAARARTLAGRGLNPLTDPLEQIFPRACDDLQAYWNLRRTLYDHPAAGPLVRADGVGKALDALAAFKTERDTARADAKLAGEKLAAAQKGLLAEQEALKAEQAALKAEKEGSAKLADDLKAEKTQVRTLTRDYETAQKQAADLTARGKALDAALAAAEKGRRDADATLAGVAAELRGAKLLPEKHAPADVVAAAKSAAARATGPDLTSLVPPGVAGTVGGPATTGTLLDLAARAGKAEAGAKEAAAALAAAKTQAATAAAKAKEEAAAALKAQADAADTLLAKTKTAATAAVAKLREEHKAELAVAAKTAADDAAAAKAGLAAAEKRFRDQLADAVTPAEALPLWLPLLTELRRPADADPALAAAARVLKTAPPDSEDAARANTVAGLALALKRDPAGARKAFEAAKGSPAFAPAKDWGRAADVGLASLTDPAAPSRVVIDPAREPGEAERRAAAARNLDAGIAAYTAGRYAAAERALAEAARLAPADPLPWYFLGAARWAGGSRDQARDDFRQGAERERTGPDPARVVAARIAAIQGPARTALDAARP